MKVLKVIYPYLIVIGFVIVIRAFIFIPVSVNGNSMNVTLQDGNILLLNKIKYNFTEIKRFDIVVIEHVTDNALVKRVIGLPGEYIEYLDGDLYVDANIIDEPFVREVTEDFNISELDCDVIPEDMYFVMGDHRDNSMDSRSLGLIPKEDIIGYTNFIIFPLNRFGFIQ